jgi:hypothetical protein
MDRARGNPERESAGPAFRGGTNAAADKRSGIVGHEMNRTPTGSSAIKSAGYDADTRTLEIEFKGGGVYHFRDVPPEIYEQFMAAESKGKFHAANIAGKFTGKAGPTETAQ